MKHYPTLALGLLLTALAAPAAADADSRLEGFTPIMAAGANHSLLVDSGGNVWAWGKNDSGQVGDGSQATRNNPVLLATNDCAQLSAGSGFSVCVGADGSLWTWGANDRGQLGTSNKPTISTTPSSPNSNQLVWRHATAGHSHALALQYDGTLWGWGSNGSGQLGVAGGADQIAPTKIGSGSSWIAIGAGDSFSVALAANGTLWSSGKNTSGQLGRSGTAAAFAQIGAAHWKSFSVGTSHVLAIQDDGSLWAWGANDACQLGDGCTSATVAAPERISAGPWRAVSAGDKHSLAISVGGVLYAWGNDASGELGLGAAGNGQPKKTPQTVGTASDWLFVAAGTGFSMGMEASGSLSMWGNSADGKLGMGSGVANQHSPAWPWFSSPTDTWHKWLRPFVLGAGTSDSYAIRWDGSMLSWGGNNYGQLGNGTRNSTQLADDLHSVVRFAGTNWLAVAAGEKHALAVTASGQLYAWGGNDLGELGNGVQSTTPTLSPKVVGNDPRWLKVSAHYEQSFGLKADGTLYGWGDNSTGQVGNGDPLGNPVTSPTKIVAGSAHWVAVAASEDATYGITSDGKLWAWGDNNSGQLGTGNAYFPAGSKVPVQIGSDTDWVAVGAMYNWAVALKANGKAFAWGLYGATVAPIGTGSNGGSKSPVDVSNGWNFYQLATSRYSVMATSTYGNVLGWGLNTSGELAQGTTDYELSPTASDYYGPRAIACGTGHCLEIESNNGFQRAVGDNTYGQLGNGQHQNSYFWPVYVH